MKIALDVQHQGKPSHPSDRGASSGGVEEVSLTRAMLDAADKELRRLGHQVLPISDGEYSARWARADAWRADIYVALHVDAGGGNRGTVFYDHRSITRGQLLAVSVAHEIDSAVPWAVTPRACHPDTNGTPRDGDYSEAYNCIQGVRAVALLIEAGFIDGPGHLAVLQRPEIGQALARGIDLWGRTA